ncbi:MAG: type II toxin-antitoxin system VapB family antitoxin [Bacteroidetes bacterium]|nr:type II toxin-antitoxin system VapB family antitoxin [Bacteroidota bacterium]
MPTNLAIDDKLITTAQKLGKYRTKKEAVTAALQYFIAQKQRMELLRLFGTIDFDESYDYKRARVR